MFKFLFGNSGKAPEIRRETQRATVERALAEVNLILAELSPKARITVYPDEGTITVDLPEQMPDETRALPSPERRTLTVGTPLPSTAKPAPTTGT